MIRLAIGMLFILVNFAPEIGNLSINLLPEFVGYLFILSVADKLSKKSGYFKGMSGVLYLLTVYKIIDYIVLMFDLNKGTFAAVFFWLGIVATVVSLIIQFRVFCGIDEIAYDDDVRVGTAKIFLFFKMHVVLTILSYINNLFRIYLGYIATGEIIPGITMPIFRFFNKLSPTLINGIDTVGTAIILLSVVVKIVLVIFVFGVCSDYDKIMTARSAKRDRE